jgi:2-keto-myo-inositol isomerase
MNRRQLIKTTGIGMATACVAPQFGFKSQEASGKKATFKYCLNTSTIRGQKPGLKKYIEIASRAGYDGVELWVRDVKAYLEEGNSAKKLKTFIIDSGLSVENAIGFAPWLVDNDQERESGMKQFREEMLMMGSIGCKRIAAAPAGVKGDKPLDLFQAGERYKQTLDIGRETGVMPQLEFWGASPALWHLGQAAMIAVAANDPDVHMLPDVYHLYRGGSGFEGLKLFRGDFIQVFHMNDYPASPPRQELSDKDRVYPGDGAAPMKQILTDLSHMGGTKVLSVELFNRDYWKQDAYEVAKTALNKMKKVVDEL